MCGIIGIAGRKPPKSNQLLAALAHRGPDGKGEWNGKLGGKPAWFGHTRLAIVELSEAGAQPMLSRDGRWAVSFNGEIYNHMDLRTRLSGPFRGHSDTETLVELLARHGFEATLPLLNGMFAFAAADLEKGLLYLARDPFGIKPLYYRTERDALAFSSEIRALRVLSPLAAEVNGEALQTFLTLRYVPSPDTLLHEVKRLPPGHWLRFSPASGGVATGCYIEPTHGRFTGSFDEASEAYGEALTQAVRRQLMSDVPMGILLSGGIDSALVAAMAAKEHPDIASFSVGFGPEYPECELEAAAHTARVLGIPNEAVIVTPEMLQQALPEMVASVEEPLGTTSIMPMWFLARKAREQATVVLTGQGSDEPWGGYRRYQLEGWRDSATLRLGASVARRLSWLHPRMPEAARRGMMSLGHSALPEAFAAAYTLFTPTECAALTGRADAPEAIARIRHWLGWLSTERCGSAEAMMRIDTRMNLADDLLLYGDKITMAASLEARVPMLDIELVRFIESLPIHYRLGRGKGKILHRHMAEAYLPRDITQRKKIGFQVPFGAWSRGIWKEWLEAVLLTPQAKYLHLISREAVQRMWDEHQAGRPDRSRQIFALLTLALWAEASF